MHRTQIGVRGDAAPHRGFRQCRPPSGTPELRLRTQLGQKVARSGLFALADFAAEVADLDITCTLDSEGWN
jgi:hypothetical protein